MLITNRVWLSRIFSGTWKHFIVDLLVCGTAYLLNYFFIIHYLMLPPIVPTLLGTALAFFIGFNNNQAYDRWWEARKIWGALVNDSRTWARHVIYFIMPPPEMQNEAMVKMKEIIIKRHLAFVHALKENLRGASAKVYREYLPETDIPEIESQMNKANAILSLQTRDLANFYQKGIIDGFTFLELNKIITNFCDEMGQSERIKNTIFPTTYSYYARFFIWIFIVCITIVTADTVGWWSILLGTLVGYVFLTIHTIGQALLNPFDFIPTGIPLDQITRTIEINLLQMIKHPEIPDPIKNINQEYVM